MTPKPRKRRSRPLIAWFLRPDVWTVAKMIHRVAEPAHPAGSQSPSDSGSDQGKQGEAVAPIRVRRGATAPTLFVIGAQSNGDRVRPIRAKALS
jgi:hypothetical protein